ncbi:MAG: glycosyltransferase [Candidatus Kapabacteria bacterium]|nr:glycosyltransferase [Candidatus Kapabacteria bacterium]
MSNVLLFSAALVYLVRLAYFWRGQWRSGRALPLYNESVPRVTVVVPARNEERLIASCIESLVASDYPSSHLEIIVVNDRSTDATAKIIDELARLHTCVRALHRQEADARENLRGKPGALQFGIDHASGEIILITDADCSVHPLWVRTMVAPFTDPSVEMTAGLTVVRPSSTFARIQDIEWVYTSSMAQAANSNGHPLGCFGNNIAIRSSAFAELGGYRGIPFSVTEDLALMQAIHGRHGSIVFLCEPTGQVVTEPCSTVSDYLRQKQRWVQGGLGLGWRGFTFIGSSVVYWVGLVSSIVMGSLPWTALFLALRLVGDGVLITTTAIRMRRWYLLWMGAPVLILLLLLELMLPLLAMQRRVVWKGQTFVPKP